MSMFGGVESGKDRVHECGVVREKKSSCAEGKYKKHVARIWVTATHNRAKGYDAYSRSPVAKSGFMYVCAVQAQCCPRGLGKETGAVPDDQDYSRRVSTNKHWFHELDSIEVRY